MVVKQQITTRIKAETILAEIIIRWIILGVSQAIFLLHYLPVKLKRKEMEEVVMVEILAGTEIEIEIGIETENETEAETETENIEMMVEVEVRIEIEIGAGVVEVDVQVQGFIYIFQFLYFNLINYHIFRDRKRGSSRDREKGGREASPPKDPNAYQWKPRKNKPSNFDMRPPDGVELPPIGVITTADGVPNSFYSYMNQALPNAVPNSFTPLPSSSGSAYGPGTGGKVYNSRDYSIFSHSYHQIFLSLFNF